MIDFGAMAEDHPAVDLARFLGDCAGDWDAGAFTAGLRAYRDGCCEFDVPDEFVRVLDRGGTVCSVIGWLRRLVVEGRPHPDGAAVAARLGRLVARAEAFAEQ